MRFALIGLCLVAAVAFAAPNRKSKSHKSAEPQIAVTSDKDIYYLGGRAIFDVRITLPPHQSMRRYAVVAMYPQPQPQYQVQLEKISPTHYRYVTPEFEEAGKKSLTVRLYRKGVMHAIEALDGVKKRVESWIAYLEGLLDAPNIPWWMKVIIRRRIEWLRGFLGVVERLVEGFYGMYVAEGGKEIEVLANRPPDKPTELLCEGQEEPVLKDVHWPVFSAVYKDPDGDAGVAYRVQVARDEDFEQIVWDSGRMGLENAVPSGARCEDIRCGEQLRERGDYWWRIKFWDGFRT